MIPSLFTKQDKDGLVGFFSILLLSFVLGFVVALLTVATPFHRSLQKEAVDRGFATFTTDGDDIVFEWREE